MYTIQQARGVLVPQTNQSHRDPPHGQGAYERLLSEIASGVLQPGDRLTETDIADRLKISRTPVREAIRQLEADGLVAHKPRAGAAVRMLDYSEVMELYDMRAVLEGAAASLAARAASDIEISELEALNAALAKASGDGQRAFELNRHFHLALLDAARNRFLAKSMSTMQKTLMILGPSTLQESARVEAVVAEHNAVLEALRARDGDRAEAAMRAHIRASHRTRLQQLRTRAKPVSDE